MKLAGVIVMGGLNSRMNGKKKALLNYNGQPFYKHITAALSSLEKIYLSVDDKAYYEKLGLEFDFIEDIYKEIGPIGGIHSTFINRNEDAFLFVPSDTPLLDKKIIDSLINTYLTTNNNVILLENNKLHPLMAIYKRECLPIILKSINDSNYRILNIAEAVEYSEVVFETLELDNKVLLDCNDVVTYTELTEGGIFMSTLTSRIERMPIPVVACTVGACTLSNVYSGLGFPIIRHITMIFGTVIFLAYLYKFIKYPNAIKSDYNNTIFASLYGVFSMLLMLLSSYYMTWIPAFKYVLIFAVILHACQIVLFLSLKLFKNFDKTFFMPSWFVTLNGIMVSTVVGLDALPKPMATAVLFWGIFAYTVFVPFMIYRLMKFEIKPPTYHTQAILIAPASLIVASYINYYKLDSNLIFVSIYYVAVLLSVLFVIIKLPKFFSVPFAPSFAGLTFPMAIGIVASQKMTGLLSDLGYVTLSNITKQISGIQIYLTTAIISYVLFNFYKMLVKKEN